MQTIIIHCEISFTMLNKNIHLNLHIYIEKCRTEPKTTMFSPAGPPAGPQNYIFFNYDFVTTLEWEIDLLHMFSPPIILE